MKSYKTFYMVAGFIFLASLCPAQAVPVVFTDRGFWQSYVDEPLLIEDFESEQTSYAVLNLSYTTDGGITLDWADRNVGGKGPTVQMLDNGLVNGSNSPHFRTFSTLLSFTFPTDQPVYAFGFDYYYSGPDIWELHLDDVEVVLERDNGNLETFFIGIKDMYNPIGSFILTSYSDSQGGMSIDNIIYSTIPEPCTLLLLGIGFVCMRKRLVVRK